MPADVRKADMRKAAFFNAFFTAICGCSTQIVVGAHAMAAQLHTASCSGSEQDHRYACYTHS